MEYKVINGTSYHVQTNQKVIDILENVRTDRTRIRLYYGDLETGKSWGDQYGVFGYIGRSCGGSIKIPLLVYNRRSTGGGALLDHCIIKIKESKGGKVLYEVKNFHE